jgi:putative membrane protein
MNNGNLVPPIEGKNEAAFESVPKRLHPSTLWLPVLVKIPGTLIFAFVASMALGIQQALFLSLVFILMPSVIFHLLRFLTLVYQLNPTELIIKSGLFWKQERRIPLKRFQDVEIQQSFVHRFLKMAKVVIKTAGSDEREATLEVVTEEDAQDFKKLLVQSQSQEPLKKEVEPQSADDISEQEAEKELLRLSFRDLIMGGLSSRIVGTLTALIGVLLYFWVFLYLSSFLDLGDFEMPEVTPFADWADYVPLKGTVFEPVLSLFLNETLGKSILLILAGFAYSILKFVVKHSQYQLFRTREILTKSEGLLTTRSSSLASDRVQALKIEETLLRRLLNLAEMWIDSAGDRNQVDDQKKRESFVPVMSRDGAFQLVSEIMKELPDPEPEWKRISRKSIFRRSRIGWLVLTLILVQSALAFGWFSLLWLPGYPLIFLYNLKRFHFTGYWHDLNYLIYRKGWLNRQTLYLPVKNIQNISLVQNPFDRRLELGSIAIDTAGQTNTGGGTVIRHLPIEDARKIQVQLAKTVASLRFDW